MSISDPLRYRVSLSKELQNSKYLAATEIEIPTSDRELLSGQGRFMKIRNDPYTYFFSWDHLKGENSRASDAVLGDFVVMVQESLPFDKFCKAHIHSTEVPTVPLLNLNQLTFVDKYDILQLRSEFDNLVKQRKEMEYNQILLKEFSEHFDSIVAFAQLGPPHPRERAVNDCLVQYLRKHLSDQYEVMVSSEVGVKGLKPTTYLRSFQDMVIFNRDNYVVPSSIVSADNGPSGTATAGILLMEMPPEEMVNYTIFSGSAEIKDELDKQQDKYEGQLLANLEKVAGDVAVRAVLERGVLINDIILYGLLIGITENKSRLYRLHIKFNGISKFQRCGNWCKLDDGLNTLIACITI